MKNMHIRFVLFYTIVFLLIIRFVRFTSQLISVQLLVFLNSVMT